MWKIRECSLQCLACDHVFKTERPPYCYDHCGPRSIDKNDIAGVVPIMRDRTEVELEHFARETRIIEDTYGVQLTPLTKFA